MDTKQNKNKNKAWRDMPWMLCSNSNVCSEVKLWFKISPSQNYSFKYWTIASFWVTKATHTRKHAMHFSLHSRRHYWNCDSFLTLENCPLSFLYDKKAAKLTTNLVFRHSIDSTGVYDTKSRSITYIQEISPSSLVVVLWSFKLCS
jgi:hypothetical protein